MLWQTPFLEQFSRIHHAWFWRHHKSSKCGGSESKDMIQQMVLKMLMSCQREAASSFHKLQDFQNQVRFPGTELDFQLWTNLPASMPQSGAAFSTCALDAWAGMFAGALELCSRASPKHCLLGKGKMTDLAANSSTSPELMIF